MQTEIVEYRGKWAVVWRDGAGERKRTSLALDATQENRDGAERAAIDFLARVAKPVTNSLSEIFAAYLAYKKRDGAISIEDMTYSWKGLKSFWGALRDDQITRDTCAAYIAECRQANLSDGTIIKRLGYLKTAVNWAKKDNAAVWKFPSTPAHRDRVLTKDDFLKLLEGSLSPHFTIWLHLAIATAGRKEAILELEWERHIDLTNRIIDLGVKADGKKRARVPMNATVFAILAEAHAKRRGPYVIQYKGAKVGNIRKAFNEAAKRAKLDDLVPHDVRHTAAVWLISSGIPIWEVSQYLGHSDSRITEKVYARYQPDHLRKAASMLDLGLAAPRELRA